MSDYNFSALDDKEFEVLVCDLLSELMEERFERFKAGKDQGVDGRFFEGGAEVILQCKHWPKSPLSSLLRSLANEESEKVASLSPSRYIFATSLQLSRMDKKKISQIFHPYILSESDIYGGEDINDLLRRFPSVERRCYKLWIKSSAIIESIFNAPIYGRTDFMVNELLENSSKYVVTEGHLAAQKVLNEKRALIVTGVAGIGKTTLAKNLMLDYLAQGFQVFCIAESVKEVEGLFKQGEKQIFYFDDFLGGNYLEIVSGNLGAHVVDFIRRVRRDPSKRFILTSRTTILNQAKMLIKAFDEANSSKDEFELRLESLTQLDRARILYSHMWHSDLPDAYIEEIYKGHRYRKIIAHPNFNPRIIEYVTDYQRVDGVDPDKFWDHLHSTLKNPADVWRHPFEAQLDDFGRALVLLVSIHGRAIEEGLLESAFYRYCSNAKVPMHGRSDYMMVLRHLIGSMLNRTSNGLGVWISLFNPSIRDFVIRRYARDLSSLQIALTSLRSSEAVDSISAMSRNEILSVGDAVSVISRAVRQVEREGYTDCGLDYVSRAYRFIREAPGAQSRGSYPANVSQFLDFVSVEPVPDNFLATGEVLLMLKSDLNQAPGFISEFIIGACATSTSEDGLIVLARLIEWAGRSSELDDAFEIAVLECFSDGPDSHFPPSEVFGDLDWSEISEAEENLQLMIASKLDAIPYAFDHAMHREIESLYDLEDQRYNYYNGDFGGDSSPSDPVRRSSLSDIDDLFDRS